MNCADVASPRYVRRQMPGCHEGIRKEFACNPQTLKYKTHLLCQRMWLMSMLQLTEKVFTAARFRRIPEMLKAGIRGKGTEVLLTFSLLTYIQKCFQLFSRSLCVIFAGKPAHVADGLRALWCGGMLLQPWLMFALACWQNANVWVQDSKTRPVSCTDMFGHGNLNYCLSPD